ncbi:TetR/AcrR family transcriptional regulator [Streptomyces sp. NPDC059629]|uniref:TetR/AcrR family transcriptional regulator n=1 Tax=Streptomyces sp. NPDC059629 TaxID=3346889 RepID=UPI00367C7EC8
MAAGVGKSTIYRWWPNKEALVADALAEVFRADGIPDLGDTHAELRNAVDTTIDNYANEDIAAALRRAVRRGDLPDDLDTDLVQDIWAGTILYRRLMTGSPRRRPRGTPHPPRHRQACTARRRLKEPPQEALGATEFTMASPPRGCTPDVFRQCRRQRSLAHRVVRPRYGRKADECQVGGHDGVLTAASWIRQV